MKKLFVRRPLQVYLYHVAWIAATVIYAYRNSTVFGRSTLIVMSIIGTFSFISLLLKPNYFEVKDRMLVMNKDFFRKKCIEIDKIEKLDIEPSPFTWSKIVMKDKTEIKYWDSHVDDKELKEFMSQFNIPIE